MTGAPIVVFSYGDSRSATYIAEAFGYEKHQIIGAEDPQTLYADRDVVAVGGYSANPWSNIFFPEYRLDSSQKYNTTLPGVSQDGKNVVAVAPRENGTKVTMVSGVYEPDTVKAAERFVAVFPSILIESLIVVGAVIAKALIV